MVIKPQSIKVPLKKTLPIFNEYATIKAKGNKTIPNTLLLSKEFLMYKSEFFFALNKNPKLDMNRNLNTKPRKTIALIMKYNSKSVKGQAGNFNISKKIKKE